MEKDCTKCENSSDCSFKQTNGSVNAHAILSKFRKMDVMMRRYMEKQFVSTGVFRGQHQVLMGLGFRPEQSQADIAEKLEISPAAVANTLNKLEKGGYIIRNSSEKDKRINHVEMTDKGREVFKESIHIFGMMESEAMAGFSEEEMNQLDNYITRLSKNISGMLETTERSQKDSKEEQSK